MSTQLGLATVTELGEGLRLFEGAIAPKEQANLIAAIAGVIAEAPLFTPRMPRTGKPFSVRMTNCGPLGWVSDQQGYRYQDRHPDTGEPWPAMPEMLTRIWSEHAGQADPPEACLVNIYAETARMGLHRDEDEKDFSAPVVSISLGAECLFRVGGLERRSPTRSVRLRSGDIVVLGGASRLAYHGVDRIYPGTVPPGLDLPAGSRINLTLRRVGEAGG